MEYIYYKAKQGNFGDDLNAWLWPKFFGAHNTADDYLLGIGSILFNRSELLKSLQPKRKIVFGSGVRPDYVPLVIDNSWDIRFLRGPLSSAALGNGYKYISDAAYALRLTKDFKHFSSVQKKYEVSLMPYFHSVKYFDWKHICEQLGYHYISPLAEQGVEFTMQEIASSEKLITKAMHGAIVADALRVPWNRFVLSTPYTEGHMVSEFKWMDWLYSVQQCIYNPIHIKLYRSSIINTWVRTITQNVVDVKFFLKGKVIKDVITQLSAVNKYYLSGNDVVKDIDTGIQQQIDKLNNQYTKYQHI